MAERGASYRQILMKYFPSTHIANSSGSSAADLMWAGAAGYFITPPSSYATTPRDAAPRLNLRSEAFRINYPATLNQRDAEALLGLLQSSRKSLLARAANAGIRIQFPVLEIVVNETTGDFVGRTGLPIWAAAATRGNQIELQPLETLKRRRILETTLRHELVHTMIGLVSHGHAPRWLAEGFALHLAGEGPLVSRHEPRKRMTTAEIDKQLGNSTWTVSANEMQAVYAAAYGEVRRLIRSEGEVSIWKRLGQ